MKGLKEKGLLSIGKVSRAHGVHGALEIFLYSGNTQNVLCQDLFYIESPNGRGLYHVESLTPKSSKRIVVRFQEIQDRTGAQALKGANVLVEKAWLEEPGEDEFYWYEIEGFEVLDLEEGVVGTVVGMMETGAHDIMICRGERGEFLIPVVGEIVKEIRRKNRIVVIDPPPGLIDCNAL